MSKPHNTCDAESHHGEGASESNDGVWALFPSLSFPLSLARALSISLSRSRSRSLSLSLSDDANSVSLQSRGGCLIRPDRA